MTILIDLNTLEQLSIGVGITQIQNSFELLISDLSDYLGKKPILKNIKIVFGSEQREDLKSLKIFNLGVKRIQEKNSLFLKIQQTMGEFLPFILLREAFYSFLPKEVNQNEMIKIYINQIVENHLEKAKGFKEWHNLIRDVLVDRDFLIAQSDKLSKFFKIENTEEHESPVQFFFNEIHENASVIGNRNILNYYDEIFEKYTKKTSKSLYNEEIVKTIQNLLRIFFKNRRYMSLKEYQAFYRKYLEGDKSKSDLSLKKFYENLIWINKFTSIAPSYNIVYSAIGLSTLHCELTFNPFLEMKKVKKLIKNLPFVRAPRIVVNSFAYKIIIAFILPKIYLEDLLKYFNKLLKLGFLIKKDIFLYRELKFILNLNYFLDVLNTSKLIDPQSSRYRKEFEFEHLIKYPSGSPILPLSIFQYAILDRIRNFSVTGLTFDKRIETLKAIKEDIENEYRKQLTYTESFRANFEKLIKSTQDREEFLSFLEQNQKHGLDYVHNTLHSIIRVSNLIEVFLINNPEIKNLHQFRNFLDNNRISQVLEENIFLQDDIIKKIIFNEFLPKYFQSIDSYRKEITKIKFFYELIDSCYNIKLFSIKSLIKIIKKPKLITEINKTKEERLRSAFKFAKSYKITNQRIESTIDDFLNCKPPIIIPMLLNTILTSTFAKFYPGTILKDTPEIRKKLEKFKSYFPRVQLTILEDLDNGEAFIHVFPFSLNVVEKREFYSSLYTIFKEGLISSHRNFWRGTTIMLGLGPRDFYDYDSKQFFYTEDFFEQFFLYSQTILGKKELERYTKEKIPIQSRLFWPPNIKIETFVNNVKKRSSRQKTNFNLNLLIKLTDFRRRLVNILLDQDQLKNEKSSEFFNTYVNSIKFIPAFRKFGLAQYFLYLCPHDWNDIDLKLLFANTYQKIKYPAQIDQNQPVLIKYLFPYRTPNKSYLNWLIKSKKAIRECCFFFIKKFYDITQFDFNLSTTGWHYSSNRFKIHIQNILFNPHYSPQIKNVREFNIDKHSKREVYGLDTPEFSKLIQLYKRRSLDLKSYLGTNKYSIINTIYTLLKNQLIFPYINLKNLGFQDKVSIILPNVESKIGDKIIGLFNFFNVSRIYEIEGDFYIYGFNEIESFETGFMIEIWFPKCELDEFLDVFDLLFEYLEIKHYLILTDLVNGKTLIKNTFTSLKFLEQYNPMSNLKWNKKDKIWMNHKLFNEKFEPIYPDMLYGIKKDKDKYNEKDYEA